MATVSDCFIMIGRCSSYQILIPIMSTLKGNVMRYDVIVIGAGMVGTSAAWHLQKNNSKTLLLDRKLPGLETSYGNAGLIQREAIHTHPFPRQLTELV